MFLSYRKFFDIVGNCRGGLLRQRSVNHTMRHITLTCVLLSSFFISTVCEQLHHSSVDRINEVVGRAQKLALKETVDKEFEKADADSDGSVSRQEFGRYLVDEDEYFKNAGKMPKHKVKKPKHSQPEIPDDDEVNSFDSDESKQQHHSDSFVFAFFNSLAMIIVTELGDKTFFIAAVMAMKHKRILVYSGAIGALAVMTVLSAVIGFALPNLLPKVYTHYAAVLLFIFFGFKLLQEAYEMHVSPTELNEELAEVEEQFAKSDGKAGSSNGLEAGLASNLPSGISRKQFQVLSQAFTLTFLAEWGDRSQIATIALASSKDPFGVTVGGTFGHAICTGLAVIGGRMLATRISEKQVALAGGSLFLVFAVHSIWAGP